MIRKRKIMFEEKYAAVCYDSKGFVCYLECPIFKNVYYGARLELRYGFADRVILHVDNVPYAVMTRSGVIRF